MVEPNTFSFFFTDGDIKKPQKLTDKRSHDSGRAGSIFQVS